MIKCALSTETVELLYKNVYAHMTEAAKAKGPFDYKAYMKFVYDNKAARSTPEHAAKIVQHIPRMIIDLDNTDFFDMEDFVDLTAIKKLGQKFLHTVDGIQNVMDEFKEKDNSQVLKSTVITKEKQAFNPPAIDPEIGMFAERFVPYSAFTSTLQEFVSIDPKTKQLTYDEKAEESKKHIYTALRAIKDSITESSTIIDDIVYQGKVLKLKAVPLSSIAQDELDTYTKDLIVKSRSIEKAGKGVAGVTPADQIVTLLLVDDATGNALRFDNEGNISEDGKIVYQFLRDARKIGDTYEVTNIYGYEDNVLTPEQIATKLYTKDSGQTFAEFVEKVRAYQQEDFKALYNLKQSVIKDGTTEMLPLLGISEGIPDFLVGSVIMLDKLNTFPNVNRDTFKTIKTVQKTRGIYNKGYATISINESEFIIDRADVPSDIARQVADVLTNKDLDFSERVDFYNQFFSNSLQATTRRHETAGDYSKKEFWFNYSNLTSQENKLRNFLDNSINLSKEALEKKTAEELKADADAIYNVLMTGKGKETKYPAKMMFNSDLLKKERYMTYDSDTQEIVFKDYINFIQSLKTPISIYSGDPGVFNTYMKFGMPSTILKQAQAAQNANTSKPSNTKQLKDQLVDKLKVEKTIDADVKSISKGFAFGKHYANFKIAVPEMEGEVKVYFPNKTGLITVDGKVFQDPTFPAKGDLVRVSYRPELTTEDGRVIKDVLEVFGIGEDGTTQSFIGYVAETDYIQPAEQPRTEPEIEEREVEEAEAAIETDPVLEDNEIINTGNTPSNPDSPIGDILSYGFEGLDRSGDLDNNVTPQEIEDAKNWWANSPLNKVIDLTHAANLVNSNVFARFTVAGKTLLQPDAPMANINIYKKGTMVDVYHEAWHGFSQLYLSPDEKLKLYDSIRNYEDAKGNKPYANKNFRSIEEMLAEDFRTYSKNPKTFKEKTPVQKSLFRKILDFLHNLFFGRKIDPVKFVNKEVVMENYPSQVDELFKKLYFAGKNPKLLNNYTPKIDNVSWDILNRGVERVDNKIEDALSNQDSSLVTASFDSVLSETIDQLNDANNGVKSGTLRLLSDKKFIDPKTGLETSNRDKVYGIVKQKFQARLDQLRAELGPITDTSFDTFDTLKDLEDNAVAIIRSKSGQDHYIFLSSQVDKFSKLNPELKNGERVKGENYKGDIKIVADFYSHKDIASKGKENADILIVNDIRDAEAQYKYFVKGGKEDFESFEAKEKPELINLTNEQEDLLNSIRILETTLNNWGDAKSGFLKYYTNNSRYDFVRDSFTEVEYEELDADGNVINDETDVTNGNDSADLFDKQVGKKSSDQLAKKETVYIVKSLFKVNKTKDSQSYVYNSLGFKELADFSKSWSILLREIGGVKNREVAYGKLVAAANDYAPELKQLVEKKLPDPTTVTTEAEFDVSASFWRDFSLSNIPYDQLTVFPVMGTDEYGNVVATDFTMEVTDASYEASNILRKFQNKFKSLQEKENPYVSKIKNVTVITELNQMVKDHENKKKPGTLNVDKSIDFLRAMGIYVDDIPAINKELKKNIEYYGVQYLYDIVKDLNNIKENPFGTSADAQQLLNTFIKDPIAVFKSKIAPGILKSLGDKEVYQKNIMDRLAKLQATYGLETSNSGVINAAGDMVFTYVKDFSISKQVDALNTMNNLSDAWAQSEDGTPANNDYKFMSYLNPEINTFTLRSQLLKSVFNFESGEFDRRRDKTFRLSMVSGTQIADWDIGTNTIDLDPSGKFLQEMHTMLKGGLQEFIRAAGKKTSLGLRVNGGLIKDQGVDDRLYVDIESFVPNGRGETYAVNNIMIPYIAVEYDRIQKFKNNKEEFLKYSGYNDKVGGTKEDPIYAGEVFTAFDNILTEDTKNLLLSEDTVKAVEASGGDIVKYIKKTAKLKEMVESDILSYFGEQTSENLNFLENAKYVDPALLEKIDNSLDKLEKTAVLVKAYTYNSWIHNFETANLFLNDIAQYGHAKENLHKRNTGAQSGGTGYPTDVYAQKFINEIWNKAGKTYASKLGEGYPSFIYDGTLNTAIIEDVERPSEYMPQIEKGLRADYEKSFKGSKLSKEEISDIIEKRIKAEMKPYAEMNEADGAGYITFDAYRTLRKAEQNWSPQQEALFQDSINGKKIKTSDVVEYFPVYKLQNFGPLANKTLAPVTAMHKFALMPLIPTEIAGSELDHLHKQMMKKNIQYMTFISGSKVGNVTSDGKPDRVFTDETMTKLQDNLNFTPNTIYLEYLKNVTEVNTHFKSKITFPTQMRGIILDGLYEKGEIADKENESVAESYISSVKDYSNILKMELLNEIDYTEKDGKYEGDLSKFLTLVQKELSKRDMPEHLIKFIGVNPDNTLKTDLSLHLEAETIEKTLLSIINKRLVKQKVNGESLVQVPSTMYNGLWDGMVTVDRANKDQVRKYLGSNNLPFYRPGKDGKTLPMKIAISLQGQFVNLLELNYLGEKIGTIERLNEAIKNDAWIEQNKEAITVTGARIPIQGLNSLEVAEIWHFLPAESGNKIVVPSELVAKAGSDFDVDKIYWMMPNINSRGEYIKSSKSNVEIGKDIESLEGKPADAKSSVNPAALIKKQKAALENNLMANTRAILELKENYATLVRPNETYLVKPIADELEDHVVDYNRFKRSHKEPIRVSTDGKNKKLISPTRTLEIGYNIHKHDVNTTGKSTLGIDALDNKLSPIWNSVGAKMPARYKESYWNSNLNKYVDGTIDYETRLLMPHNTMKNDSGEEVISLSGRYNQAGTRIGDLRSHKLNGLLDVEKDAWVAFIQANMEGTPVMNHLVDAGVPERAIFAFVSQGLTRKYFAKQRLLKGSFTSIINKGAIAKNFIPSKAALATEATIPFKLRNKILNRGAKMMFDARLGELNNSDDVLVTLTDKTEIFTTVGELEKLVNSGDMELNSIKEIASVLDAYQNVATIYQKPGNITGAKHYYYMSLAASEIAGISKDKPFDTEKMMEMIKEPGKPENAALEVAAFMHFLETEKLIRGISAVKTSANPDTKISKNIQQVKSREEKFLDVLESSKVDKSLPDAIRNRSVLSSFYLNDLSIDLIEPLFPLRLNKDISAYLKNIQTQYSGFISAKFGEGQDGQAKFVNQFNNGVINYILQNYLSNFVNTKAEITAMPDKYRSMDIIESPEAINGALVKDGKIYINTKVLEKDFKDKAYIDVYQGDDGYVARGLAAFSAQDNPFPTQSSYNRYVLEREYLRSIYADTEIKDSQLQRFEIFLNRKALFNVFNQKAIMGTDAYSYTDQVMEIIEKYPNLKDQYPILGQLAQAPYKNKKDENIKVMTLNDKDMVTPDIAAIYRQNLRQLGDVTVRKVKSTDEKGDIENKRISDIFNVFSLMMLYQHGVGYSKFGFPKVLDETEYVSVMKNAAGKFMENNINENTLDSILKNVFSDKQFKNYVKSPYEYNESTAPRYSTELTFAVDQEIQDYATENGSEALAKIYSKLGDIAVIGIPEDASRGQYMDNAYSVYHPLIDKFSGTNNVHEYLSRAMRAHIDTDNAPDIFYNFDTDEELSLLEFRNKFRQAIKDSEVDILEEPEEVLTEETEIEKEDNYEDYEMLNTFYRLLKESDETAGTNYIEKLGNLEEIIDEYVQMYQGTMSEEQYIDNVLKCKL